MRTVTGSKWFTKEVKDAMRKRDDSYKKAVRIKASQDFEEYKNKRNKVVATVRKIKKQYYRKEIQSANDDSKKIWMRLKELLGRQKTTSSMIIINVVVLQNHTEIADKLNRYLINSIEEILNTL